MHKAMKRLGLEVYRVSVARKKIAKKLKVLIHKEKTLFLVKKKASNLNFIFAAS